jgi:pentatricopeptide repeat protein
MKKAEQLMKRMKQAGLEPNVVTYGTLMLGYTSVHDTTALLRTFEELKKAGIKPNATIFTLLIRTFGQQEKFNDALSWFKMMVESGCCADQRSRAALMDACQTREQKEQVLEYFGTLD